MTTVKRQQVNGKTAEVQVDKDTGRLSARVLSDSATMQRNFAITGPAAAQALGWLEENTGSKVSDLASWLASEIGEEIAELFDDDPSNDAIDIDWDEAPIVRELLEEIKTVRATFERVVDMGEKLLGKFID